MLDGLILREPRKCQNSINANYYYDKVKAALKKNVIQLVEKTSFKGETGFEFLYDFSF